jgi:hypothetical protein
MPVHNIGDSSTVEPLEMRPNSAKRTDLLEPLDPDGSQPRDRFQVSQLAHLMSQLQQLQQSNPAEFKQVASQIAANLQQSASQQAGSASRALQQLAREFQQSSQTGQLASPGGHATPSGPPRHHGYGSLAESVPFDTIADFVESAIASALRGPSAGP